ncbi:MAG: rubredoxin-like domain-containing protein [Promethearchaeota archaeon]
MPFWKCENCGYTFQADMPPEDSICPNCKEKCTFKNVTCYAPECGMLPEHPEREHIDPRLV